MNRNGINKASTKTSYSQLGNNDDDLDTDDVEENLIRRGISMQRKEVKKQDEELDELHSAVQKLGNMSLHISNELDTQNVMLDNLNQDTDVASDLLKSVTKQTNELIKQTGGMKYFCVIIVLVLVLLLLTYLVVMT